MTTILLNVPDPFPLNRNVQKNEKTSVKLPELDANLRRNLETRQGKLQPRLLTCATTLLPEYPKSILIYCDQSLRNLMVQLYCLNSLRELFLEEPEQTAF
jgi:hypothetical protein